jgi:hypothetical protein
MAKQMTFEQKAKKEKRVQTCPVCHGPIQHIRLVKPVRNEAKGSWKFADTNVGVCKCNQAEVYKV